MSTLYRRKRMVSRASLWGIRPRSEGEELGKQRSIKTPFFRTQGLLSDFLSPPFDRYKRSGWKIQRIPPSQKVKGILCVVGVLRKQPGFPSTRAGYCGGGATIRLRRGRLSPSIPVLLHGASWRRGVKFPAFSELRATCPALADSACRGCRMWCGCPGHSGEGE